MNFLASDKFDFHFDFVSNALDNINIGLEGLGFFVTDIDSDLTDLGAKGWGKIARDTMIRKVEIVKINFE